VRFFLGFDVSTSVFGTLRRFGPVVLIPAGWIAAGAATVGILQREGMLIAHLVMVGFIVFFLGTGWDRMDRGVLQAWRAVLLAGLGLTLAGIAGFVGPVSGAALLGVSLVGWMVLPAAGLAYTARETSRGGNRLRGRRRGSPSGGRRLRVDARVDRGAAGVAVRRAGYDRTHRRHRRRGPSVNDRVRTHLRQ
jgi:hypothetical protein